MTTINHTKQLVIGLTCIGGKFTHLTINALKQHLFPTPIIIGMDMKGETDGGYFVDHFEKIPSPKDEVAYINALQTIHKKYSIDLLIPGSEAECLLLAKQIDKLNAINLKCSIQSSKNNLIFYDKFNFFQYLKNLDLLPVPFETANNWKEIENKLDALGYPHKKIVIKPRFSTGSRGVLVADSKKTSYLPFLEDRFCGTGDLLALKKVASEKNENFENYLLMPYLSGKTFDVDCIAKHGDVMAIASRERHYKNEFSPVNQGCILRKNLQIENLLTPFIKSVELHGCMDLDICLTEEYGPVALDVSMRMSGSVGASYLAGINIPLLLVSTLLNLPLPSALKINEKIKYDQFILPAPNFYLTKAF